MKRRTETYLQITFSTIQRVRYKRWIVCDSLSGGMLLFFFPSFLFLAFFPFLLRHIDHLLRVFTRVYRSLPFFFLFFPAFFFLFPFFFRPTHVFLFLLKSSKDSAVSIYAFFSKNKGDESFFKEIGLKSFSFFALYTKTAVPRTAHYCESGCTLHLYLAKFNICDARAMKHISFAFLPVKSCVGPAPPALRTV